MPHLPATSALVRGAALLAQGLLLACAAPAPAPAPAPRVPPSQAAPARTPDRPRDPHSFARPHQVVATHLDLALHVSFADSALDGVATYTLDRHDLSAPFVLDARGLQIHRVELAPRADDRDANTWSPARWTLGSAHPQLGAPLRVDLPETDAARVRIHYRARDAAGLQWLSAEQTAGAHPFLYSQSQPILARTWLPIQDSPGVRLTYDARVTVDRPLQPLMSADYRGLIDGRHSFVMDRPIPAYLLALAVGDLQRRELGPRTAVWAEPPTLDLAAAELRDLGDMLSAVERRYGPYAWGRYDVLILPPAFPYGGMENPVLTFATPTILAGDRSLISLIVHEIAHSWAGNLVTASAWRDLWLSEGITTYLERRILEDLYGRDRAEMEAELAVAALHQALRELPPADQRLVPELRGRDPDELSADIIYEKGALLIRALEETYGRDRLDPVLRAWFTAEDNAFTSRSTADFTLFLQTNLLGEAPLPGRAPLDLDAWLYAPGLPAGAPEPRAAASAEVEALAASWLQGQIPTTSLATDAWPPQRWLHFFGQLPAGLPAARLAELDRRYHFTDTGNHELLATWLLLAVRSGHDASPPVRARLRDFLTHVGRRKHILPIYSQILQSDPDRARALYREARPRYHPIVQATLDPLLGAP